MGPKLQWLAPTPMQRHTGGEPFAPPADLSIGLAVDEARLRRAAGTLADAFQRVAPGSRIRQGEAAGAQVRLRLDAGGEFGPQGYSLAIDGQGVEVIGGDEAGLFYGVQTLRQWLRLHRARKPIAPLRVRDRPDLARRGVMLDVSRNRVPTMARLYAWIDRLASWKINELQLYTEHAFAYTGHETVWRGADPITPEEARALDAYCRDRFIELIPNQNSFGHFHRWLRHERYRKLAEVPAGVSHPFSLETEPFSLCPLDPGALALLDDLYAQLLPNFHSRWFNVGLDETFDLGQGRSAAACAERGRTEVYLAFLNQVRELAAKHGRRIQFWGDIVLTRPDLLGRVPQDALPLIWGYEADHPFEEQTRLMAASGLSYYVCPGTSAWHSFAGRARNTLENVAAAARWGHAHGAAGCLIADWGDSGHLQPPAASALGFLAGAAFAWNTTLAEAPAATPIEAWLSAHAFDEPGGALGAAARALGDVYRACGFEPLNGSALFFLFRYIDQTMAHERLKGLSAEGLERAMAAIGEAATLLSTADPGDAARALTARELAWSAGMLRWCVRLGQARLAAGRDRPVADIAAKTKAALRDELTALARECRTLWLATSRPGGLAESLAWFARVERALTA